MQEVVVTKLDGDAIGVGKIKDRIILIGKVLPDEVVKIREIESKNKYDVAIDYEVVKQSQQRVEPLCPYYDRCGGCSLQHANYQYQKEFKINKVKKSIKCITNKEIEIDDFVESDKYFGYRNKIVFAIKNSQCGMYQGATKNFVKIEKCLLVSDNLNYLYKLVASWIEKYKIEINHVALREVGDNYSIVLVGVNKPKINELVKRLDTEFKNKYQIVFNYNNAFKDLITDKLEVLYGGEIFDENFGVRYPVSANTFLQVNKYIADKIYQEVSFWVKDKEVINSYSGAGLLSAIISQTANNVYGVEIVANATANANKLKEDNGIINMVNINGRSEIEVPKILKLIKNTILVFDPPRKGVDSSLLNIVNKSNKIDNIIYISCDPNSLAKDLRLLINYDIKSIKLFDMFPQTKHIETLVYLTKKI